MKKIILFIILVFASIGIFGQNVFKYEIQANGGIRVGDATNVRVDSIVFNGTYLIIYSGADTVGVYTPYAEREIYEMLELDSALVDMSTPISDAIISNDAPLSTGTVIAGDGITSGMLSRFMYFNTAAPINITSDPQIANGTSGQTITIIGSSDTNTLTIEDGTGLRLNTATIVLGIGDNVTLYYDGNIGDWIQIVPLVNN